MHFGKHVSKPTFTMYGNVLNYADEYKYLGIVVAAGKAFSTSDLHSLILSFDLPQALF